MAVEFDGSTYLQRTANLANISSGQKFTFSTWINADSGEGGVLFAGGPSITARIQVSLTSGDGKFSWVLRNSSGTLIWAASTDNTFDDGDWHHMVTSVDLSTQTVLVYVDRVSQDLTTTTAAADDTIDFAGCTEWDIGQAFQAGGTAYQGEMFDLLFCAGVALDLTDATELRRVVSSDGATEAVSGEFRQNVGPDAGVKPVGYGADARRVFDGTRPQVFYSGAFSKNRGNGGEFTLVGAFDSSRGPNIYRHAALRSTPGERWFDSERSGFSYPRSETFIEQREGLPAFGKRLGLDEMDEETRGERPGLEFSQLVLGTPGLEDDSEEDRI